MKKRVILGLGLACLACCMPLLLPGLAASGLAGGGGWLVGLDWAEITCLAVVAAVVAAMLVLAARRHRRKADGSYCDVGE